MFKNLARKLGIGTNSPAQTPPSPSTSLELSPIKGEKNVIIFTGWAGAGKTNLLKRLVYGLETQLSKVAGIVNEQTNSGSINVDLGRLPPGFDKIGMAGCICCIGVQQVKEALTRFSGEGKYLTVLEQSPLSNTSDLRRAVDRHGFNPFVIAVLKPGQLVPRYSAEQIRAADAVVITGKITEETKRILKELTSDLTYRPKFFEIDGAGEPFPHELWELAQKPRDQRVSEYRATQSGIGAESEAARKLDVSHFTELQIVPYPLAEGETLQIRAQAIIKALEQLKNSTRENVEILRVKGVFAGQDFDITRDDSGLNFSIAARDYARSDVSPGQDYLYIRSLDSRLKDSWQGLFEAVGTPICSPQAVEAVTSLYPSKDELFAGLTAENTISGVFEADSLLWELGDSLEHFQSIPESSRQQELGEAVVELTKKFLKSRLDVLEILQTSEAKALSNYNSILFDTLFIGTRILVHPQIKTLFDVDGGQDELIAMSEAFWKLQPVTTMLNALANLDELTINGSHDLTSNDLAWLSLFIKEEKVREALGQCNGDISEIAKRTYEAVTQTAESTQSDAWISYGPMIKAAFGVS